MKRNLISIAILFMATCILKASDKPDKLRKDDIPRNEKQMWARIDAMQDEVEDGLLSHDQRFLDELELARKKVADIMLTAESDKRDKKAVQELRQRCWTFWTRTVSEVEVEDVKEYNLNTALGQRAPVAQAPAARVAPWPTEQYQLAPQQWAPVGGLKAPAIESAAPLSPREQARVNFYNSLTPEEYQELVHPSVHSDGTPVYYDSMGRMINQPPYALQREGYGYVKFGFTSPRPRHPYAPSYGPVRSYPKPGRLGQGYIGSGRATSASSGRHK